MTQGQLVPQEDLPKEALLALHNKDFSRAADLYRQVVEIDPHTPGFWSNLSVALRHIGHREAALACARRAIDIEPDDILYRANLSDCFVALDRMDEAVETIEKVLETAPDNLTYRRKYIAALRQNGRLQEGIAQAEITRAKEPDDVETNWQQGGMYLSLGNFPAGWKDFELRWKRGFLKGKDYGKAALWAGENLNGKTILLHEEQGFGDTILSSRFVPLVKKNYGGRILFQCRPVLHALFKNLEGVDRYPLEGPLGEGFQYHVPLLSLPGIFNTTVDTIPPPTPLAPAETLPPEVMAMLAAGKGRLKVGIVWTGNPEFRDNHKRAVPLDRFMPLTEIPGLQFYSLQKGAGENELAAMGAQGLIFEPMPYMKDFADTAALVNALDLVIMTDSSVAHLAGSLGKPVWNLLHYSPFWVYLMDRTDSPWYPSMRLFRQKSARDWDGVFKEVAAELAKIVKNQKAG